MVHGQAVGEYTHPTRLVEMAGAGGVVVGVPAFCVGVGQPGDELADLLVGARAEDEVPVIGQAGNGDIQYYCKVLSSMIL